jgi:selenide, water dikinase
VYQINESQAIVATTDFFMPIVDDPFDFEAIAATNAKSDVYAMGGTLLFAPALVGMPINTLPTETIRRILEGGESLCARAGIPVAGGHSIDSVEPIYGLVPIGLVHPKHVKRNADTRAGDKLVLSKPPQYKCIKRGVEGTGALRRPLSSDDRQYDPVQHIWPSARIARGSSRADRRDRLRVAGSPAASVQGREGCCEHRLERCSTAFPGCASWCGKATGPARQDATGRVTAPWWILDRYGELEQMLLTDPRTSGGLLVGCAPDAVEQVLELSRADGFEHAAVIGEIAAGAPDVKVA